MNYKALSYDLRKDCVDIIMAGGGGHIGGDMSVMDVLISLYYRQMNISPDNLTDPNRDRFVLSKGHAMEAYYAVLCSRGFLDLEDVKQNFSKFGSSYIGHPNNKLPGIEMNSGSLGHGLPVCVGMALAGKMDHRPYSNASRTQLFNIHTLAWDIEVCAAFGLDAADLPEVTASDDCFGYTDIGGLLPKQIPICGVLGDSHAALFGQGCLEPGMAKATYGTGSSIMMNIGAVPIESRNGLVTSLAWKYRGQVNYVMEGNLNYTGAVIRWIEKDLGLAKASETQALAESANQDDTTVLVPAFTGLGAPYWSSDAKAMICGITRLTGKAELVKAGLDCIAYQITDIVEAMERDTNMKLSQLRVDGGPTKNGYLMQLQSDLLDAQVLIPSSEELSGIGAAYMAGLTQGIYDNCVFASMKRTAFTPCMDDAVRQKKYSGWQNAVAMVLGSK